MSSSSTPSSATATNKITYKFFGGIHTCPEQILTDIQSTKTFPPAASNTIFNSAFEIARRVVMHDEVSYGSGNQYRNGRFIFLVDVALFFLVFF